jgi:hypothetical protein
MKDLLSDNELRLLNSPENFYSIGGIKYELKSPVNEGNSTNIKKYLDIIIDYKPCFSEFADVYNNVVRKELKFPLFESKNNDLKENFLILIHGFKSKNQKIYYQLAERFSKRGITSLVYTIPFHFERMPESEPYKSLIDGHDFRATLELFRNTIIELRILVNELKNRNHKKVGCLGFSFGGCCASLLCCLEPKVDFVVPMASLADFNTVIRAKKNKKKAKQENKHDTGSTESADAGLGQLNEYLTRNFIGLISPIGLKPLIGKKNIQFIQGLFDYSASYFNLQRLLARWDYPPAIFYPCDHFTFFLFNRLTVELIKNFIRKLA